MAKKQPDPSDALHALMDAPGTPDDIWDDLLGSIGDDPKDRLVRALVGHPKYDDRAAAIVFGAMLEHALEIAIGSVFASTQKRIKRLFSYQQRGPLATFSAKVRKGGSSRVLRRTHAGGPGTASANSQRLCPCAGAGGFQARKNCGWLQRAQNNCKPSTRRL